MFRISTSSGPNDEVVSASNSVEGTDAVRRKSHEVKKRVLLPAITTSQNEINCMFFSRLNLMRETCYASR